MGGGGEGGRGRTDLQPNFFLYAYLLGGFFLVLEVTGFLGSVNKLDEHPRHFFAVKLRNLKINMLFPHFRHISILNCVTTKRSRCRKTNMKK